MRFFAMETLMSEARSLLHVLVVVAVGAHSPSRCPAADDPRTTVHDSIDRAIVREPEYASAPKYSLLVLDDEGTCKVWIVEDGQRLYVDRNGNADLTDDGPPLETQNRRDYPGAAEGPYWAFEYHLEEFAPPGPKVTQFKLTHWKQGDLPERHGLSLTLNALRPMYAGWFGLFSDSPDTAPVVHLGGKLQPQKLRGQMFVLGSANQRLSIAFINPGRSMAEHARLSIDAVPESVVPVAEIDWPVNPGEASLRTSHTLRERCCYWEFYDSHFHVPNGVAPGMAKVTVSIPDAVLPFEFSRDTVEIPVHAGDSYLPTLEDK